MRGHLRVTSRSQDGLENSSDNEAVRSRGMGPGVHKTNNSIKKKTQVGRKSLKVQEINKRTAST